MNIALIILIPLVAAILVLLIFMKKQVIKDENQNNIPDVVEDTIEEVKHRAKLTKEEVKDVIEAAKKVVDQAEDVVDAVKGKPRRGRKSSAKSTTADKPKSKRGRKPKK